MPHVNIGIACVPLHFGPWAAHHNVFKLCSPYLTESLPTKTLGASLPTRKGIGTQMAHNQQKIEYAAERASGDKYASSLGTSLRDVH